MIFIHKKTGLIILVTEFIEEESGAWSATFECEEMQFRGNVGESLEDYEIIGVI